MIFTKIGVVGAGVMGCGVTQNLIQTGHQVVLVDNDPHALIRASQLIHDGLRHHMMFDSTLKTQSIEALLAQVDMTTDMEKLCDVDFVVENVTERWDIKAYLYPQLDSICPAGCVIAANTSAMSITRIAGTTLRPDKIVGMHFMNPVPRKCIVEIVKAHHTSEETLEEARRFIEQMGKQAVTVNDYAGFVSNRLSHLFMNEAVWVVQDGVAGAQDVDAIFTQEYGHEMGPLQTADLIGLDTVLDTLNVLYDSYGDPKFRAAPLLKRMVDAGLLGRKSGEGFYQY